MARIPNDEIERIKREIDLKALIESYGVKLDPKGKDWSGLCPLHNDTSPSLLVSPEKGLWHCLGACQTGGTVFDWVMKMEKVSFWHAYKRLLNPDHQPREAMARKVSLSRESSDQELLGQVIGYYHATLKDSPDALNYLQKRKLIHPELIDHFKLGYANKTLSYLLPKSWLKAGIEMRLKLQDAGLVRETSHEHFAGCLVIPVTDEHGQIAELYGRRVEQKIRKGASPHLYLPGPHKGVFNIEALQSCKEIILCEALIDALTFWCYGFRNVTASYGVNGFTNDHFEAFKKYEIKKVLIAYDHDEAGDSAAEKLAQKLSHYGVECLRLRFPLGMDANKFAQCSNHPEKDLNKVILGASAIGCPADYGGLPVTAKPTEKIINQEEPESGSRRQRDDIISAPWPGAVQELKVAGPGLSENSLQAKDSPAAQDQPATDNSSSLPAAILAAKDEPIKAPDPVYQLGASALNFPVEIKKEEVTVHLGDRRWRIRGLSKNMSYEQLRVNVMVSFNDQFFVDTIDLYSSRLRATFVKLAATELEINEEIIKTDLSKVFLKLEELQDEQIKRTLQPKKTEVFLSEFERKEALSLLEDPKLLERILADFAKCGVAGEETNKLVGYLAAVSRKLENPLAVIIQSSSAAGKTWLMEAVLSFMPEEERVKYSAMTGQSLYYLGDKDLKNKILAIVEEEGAEKASYALKLLQSEGELSIASTGKDPQTGKLITHEYRVEGPVMIFITTTSIDIDEELQNRCLVLTVNESREQTRAIHQLQRQKRTLAGLQAKKDRATILKIHRNAQRLLRPLAVVNPYAPKLTFLDDRTRTRRDHDKYLNLIEAIALLHQYQRPVKRLIGPGCGSNGGPEEYIEVEISDIETANQIAGEVLGRSLDELPPQTRQLLGIIEKYVSESSRGLEIEKADFRFSRRNVREYCNWNNSRLVKHLERLEELEYLILHRGGRGQTFVYELLYEGNGKDGKPFMMGLIDVSRLQRQCEVGSVKCEVKSKETESAASPHTSHLTPHTNYDANLTPLNADLTPQNTNLTPSKHPQNTGVSPTLHPGLFAPLAANRETLEQLNEKNSKKSCIGVPSRNMPFNHSLSAVLKLSAYYSLLAAKEKEFDEYRQSKQQAACVEPLTSHQPLTTSHAAAGGNGDGRK